MVKLNDLLELDIIDVNYEGYGIARYDNSIIFVSGAISGERVKAKVDYITKNYIKAHVIEIIKKSCDRLEEHCVSYPKCGGCQLMHIKYEESLKYKMKAFNDTLKRIGHIDYEANKIIFMENPNGYRNKIQMPFSIDKNNNLIMGYYQLGTHNVIPFRECYLQSDNVSKALVYIYNLLKKYDVKAYNETTKKGCLRHILIRENYKKELMIVFITNEKKINNIDLIVSDILKNIENVVSIVQNINELKNNVILGNQSKVLFGKDEIIDKIGDIYYKISHKSFFQVNRIQAEKLYNKVIEYIGENNNFVIDAYCGVGSISLILSQKCKFVCGIEVVKEAIDDANMNALLNKISNVKFVVGKVEEEIFEILNNHNIDAVVIDPPRKGIDVKVLNALKDSGIETIVYVSCNPATLARDLSLFTENYNIEDITLVDMFCYTNGLESVVKLKKKN